MSWFRKYFTPLKAQQLDRLSVDANNQLLLDGQPVSSGGSGAGAFNTYTIPAGWYVNIPFQDGQIAQFLSYTTVTVDQVPYLTSNTQDGITVSASSIADVNSDVWKAFDNNANAQWTSASTGPITSGDPQWILVDFGPGVQKSIKTITIGNRNSTLHGYEPSAFTAQYSDDGVNFLNAANFTDNSAWGTNLTRTYNVTTPKAGRYFRLLITGTIDATYLYTSINKLQLSESVDSYTATDSTIVLYQVGDHLMVKNTSPSTVKTVKVAVK
jgi:hypothetical protein